MSIAEDLNGLLKQAMRDKDQRTLDVIRMIRSKVTEARTAPGFHGEVDDALHVQVIALYSKQMKKAIAEYEAQGDRTRDMVEKLQFEVDYLEQFLPKKLGEAETRQLVKAAIAELGATDPKQKGRVMGAVLKAHKDDVDPQLVGQIATEELGG
jgi:uncharacterized protein YqeY